ncbi:hypothetical protein V8E36_006540 [Tilletia maclaganii]
MTSSVQQTPGGVAAMAKRWETANAGAGTASNGSGGVTTSTSSSKFPAPKARSITSSSKSSASSPAVSEDARTPKIRDGTAAVDADSSADAWAESGDPAAPASAPTTTTAAAAATDTDLTATVPATPELEPSIGAKSLIEPGATIANPFASSLTSTDSPKRYSSDAVANPGGEEEGGGRTITGAEGSEEGGSISGVAAPASVGTASTSASRRQSFQSATDMRRAQSANGDRDNAEPTASSSGEDPTRDSSHFSVVSLGGDTKSRAADPDSSATPTTAADPDTALIQARAEAQTAQLKRDPKAWRASIDGAAKLREEFERKMQASQSSPREKRSTIRNVAEEPTPSASGTHDEAHAGVSSGGLGLNEHTPTSTAGEWGGTNESAAGITDAIAELPESTAPAEEEDGVDWTFWGEIMSNYAEVAHSKPQELSRAIRRGIPPALRGMMWQLMSSSKDEELEIIYAYYLKQTSPHEKAIRRDLSRTFPEQEYFSDGKGVGQENLFNVIKAYSLYDEECGYCQGMQFVVGPLLLNAFSTLARLMKSYDLRGHYIPNMPSLQLRLFQFDRLLEEFLPLLHRHLTRQGVKSSMYAAQWFMTRDSYRFPLELVYRILDSVFAEGIETLFRFSIALMQRNEEKLLSLGFEAAVQFLKDSLFDAYLRDDLSGDEPPNTPNLSTSGPAAGSMVTNHYQTARFVTDAYEVRITPYQLDSYAAEFEEHVRKANAHRREVDALRLVNRNLSAKIKDLEVQLTQVNNEHVDLVKQVVMAKLEKDEIAEELARYKLMYAEAVLQADQDGGPGGRGSSAGLTGFGSLGASSTRTSRSVNG